MKIFRIKSLALIVLTILLLGSCASNKSILYLQNEDDVNPVLQPYSSVLEPDDVLNITVTADEPQLANPFNMLFLVNRSNDAPLVGNDLLTGYLVDQKGEIDFPVLGKIKLAGITRMAAEIKIKELLKPHIANPGVNLRVVNFKISVLGEVKNPGGQVINGDRITLLEALSNAGDLTIYGKRNSIIVLRENAGVRAIEEVDITTTDFLNSPYYYLAHNDVIYVKPNKTRVNSSIIGPNLTVGISAISLLITIITLSTR